MYETNCVIFDIDGTLANIHHRLNYVATRPKNFPAFYAAAERDEPFEHIVMLAKLLWTQAKYQIIICTGREETTRAQTTEWLAQHGINYHLLCMRRAGDSRQDVTVKEEILDEMIALGYSPLMVFEDRSRVVQMWRRRGIPCLQVAEGEY
jgi:FMN phosphatase YigB (HAD superfamily)